MKQSLCIGLVLVLTGPAALAQFAPDTQGVTWPAGAPRPLPDFDVRLSADGRPAPGVNERNAELRTEAALSARAADARELLARTPFLRIDADPVFGTPRWVASTAGFLTAAGARHLAPRARR